MKKYTIAIALLSALMVACGPKNEDAKLRLANAREFFANGQYVEAKSEIDSITKLFEGRAFEERKAALVLLDSVRFADDVQIIKDSEELIAKNQIRVDSMKKLFVFSINKEYQDLGFYLPKETASSNVLAYTTLRSGVAENGDLYLESVFVGAQKHSRMTISVAKGESLETEDVTEDGFNHSFTNLGKRFEVIRFTKVDEMAKLIAANEDKTITVVLNGKSKNSFTLSKALKSAVGKSYRMSLLLKENSKLQDTKNKAGFRIKYIENKEEVQQINRELKATNETMRTVGDKH